MTLLSLDHRRAPGRSDPVAARPSRDASPPRAADLVGRLLGLQQGLGNQVVQRRAADGPALGAAGGLIQRQEAALAKGDCSGWESDLESFSKAVADHYVRTEIDPTLVGPVSRITCDPGIRCTVDYSNGLSVMVSLTQIPDYVIVRRMFHPTGPRCEYDYACTPQRTVETAKAIPGARSATMAGIGHFPMAENYPRFREYLLPILRELE